VLSSRLLHANRYHVIPPDLEMRGIEPLSCSSFNFLHTTIYYSIYLFLIVVNSISGWRSCNFTCDIVRKQKRQDTMYKTGKCYTPGKSQMFKIVHTHFPEMLHFNSLFSRLHITILYFFFLAALFAIALTLLFFGGFLPLRI